MSIVQVLLILVHFRAVILLAQRSSRRLMVKAMCSQPAGPELKFSKSAPTSYRNYSAGYRNFPPFQSRINPVVLKSVFDYIYNSTRPSIIPATFFVCLFYMKPLIASGQIIGTHGTDVSVRIRLLSRETLLQAKNFSGHRWGSNSGPCRQHGYCCKRSKPLHHLDRFIQLLV